MMQQSRTPLDAESGRSTESAHLPESMHSAASGGPTERTESASAERREPARIVDINAAHAAILTATLELADSLLRQAARDIEATLFERVFDRLRTALPELVDRALQEHAAP